MADTKILNVNKYNEKVSKQLEVFSKIDTTMAILEKLPSFTDTALSYLNSNSFIYSDSALGFVFNILHSLGVDEEKLKEWIVEILVYVLPTVEVGIKASLLSNIKSIISCNSDPRIPLWLRKRITDSVYTNTVHLFDESDKRGLDINVDAIDPEGILDLSPFTQPGMSYYFGCTNENVSDTSIKKVVSKYDDGIKLDEVKVIGDGNARTANLVRADDFNAFIWYVIHKGNKQNPYSMTIGTEEGWKYINIGDGVIYNIISNKNGVLEVRLSDADIQEGKTSNILAGNTFYFEDNPRNIYICIKTKYDENNEIPIGNTIVPMSSDWFSCNWYVDKSNYYSSNLGFKEKKNRNYSKEKGICNLRYLKQSDYLTPKDNTHFVNPSYPNSLRFTILPKPYVLLPDVTTVDDEQKIKLNWRPIRLLFDSDGNPDQNGRYSLISESYRDGDVIPDPILYEPTGGSRTIKYKVKGIENGQYVHCTNLTVNIENGSYSIDKNFSKYKKVLVECYPGLTVYEFNYDYIMGMKLFDPKVICQKIFDNASNPKFDAHFKLTLNKTKDKKNRYPFESERMQIVEIVNEILDEDGDSDITDCFFRFSNEQYDEMLRKTEEIRYRQMPYNQGYNEGLSVDFTEVTKILEGFPEDGSVEEQKAIINSALTKACDIMNSRGNTTVPSDSSTIRVDFLTNLLQQLAAAIIDSVLSPKVLMLFVVNETLMGGQSSKSLTTKDLMKILKNVITAVVREVRDLIVKKLVDYILEYLTPIALQIHEKILSEQFADYMAIIKLLLSSFNKGVETVSRVSSVISSMNSIIKDRLGDVGKYGDITEIDLPSILDNVNYADIYPSENKDKEPTLNNC